MLARRSRSPNLVPPTAEPDQCTSAGSRRGQKQSGRRRYGANGQRERRARSPARVAAVQAGEARAQHDRVRPHRELRAGVVAHGSPSFRWAVTHPSPEHLVTPHRAEASRSRSHRTTAPNDSRSQRWRRYRTAAHHGPPWAPWVEPGWSSASPLVLVAASGGEGGGGGSLRSGTAQSTCGFQSWWAPVGLGFQAQAWSS